MNAINKMWTAISLSGVDNDKPRVVVRRIVLTNKISALCAMLALLGFFSDNLVSILNNESSGWGTYRVLFIAINCIIVLIINKYRQYTLAKILLSVGTLFFLVVFPVIIKHVNMGDYGWLPYGVIALSVVPHLTFDSYNERKSLVGVLLLFFICMLFVNDAANWVHNGKFDGVDTQVQYNFVFKYVVKIIFWLLVNFGFFYESAMNHYYENQLEKAKQIAEEQTVLIHEQNDEIITQTEELVSHQEEILAQRDAIEEANKVLQQKNQAVTESINAAKMIQMAVVPPSTTFEQLFADYLILFRPKDIVSGDFYWVSEHNGEVLLVAADCTGHGVPGAFMSLIGNVLLERIVKKNYQYSPSEILTQIHQQLHALINIGTRNMNGIDMAIVNIRLIDQQHVELVFSAAGNKAYIVTPDEPLHELSSSVSTLGIESRLSGKFENQKFVVPRGSMLYMPSDGFQDQNNEQRARFGRKPLKELFQTSALLPCQEQKNIMDKTLNNFMANTEQRDDIMIIGVRL